ncbi:MAG TPA: hypothetical protein VI564_07800 [Candidatus Nanoarchaeia archaeon]|nr:hypothetical protein [Candidatus Nanoarchaeia archaeon]
MANGILSEFSQSDINIFMRDFMQILKSGFGIDRVYAHPVLSHSGSVIDDSIKQFELAVSQFNKKYTGIKLKTRKMIDSFNVEVFVKERNLKDFFANSASRIAGLKSIGSSPTSMIEVSNAESFSAFIDRMQDKLFVQYSDQQNGSSSINASFGSKEKMVQIIYEQSEITNPNSASFRVSAYYSLKNKFNRKIEVHSEASRFGYYSLLSETEKREWYDLHNPRFLE